VLRDLACEICFEKPTERAISMVVVPTTLPSRTALTRSVKTVTSRRLGCPSCEQASGVPLKDLT
jgi:hypothetical protein